MRKPLSNRASDLICKAIMQNGGSATVERGIEIHRFLFGYTLTRTISAYKAAVRHGYITLDGDVYSLTQECADAYAAVTPRQHKRAIRDEKMRIDGANPVYVGEIVASRTYNGFRTPMPTYRVTRAECEPLNPRCNGRSDISKETFIRGVAV